MKYRLCLLLLCLVPSFAYSIDKTYMIPPFENFAKYKSMTTTEISYNDKDNPSKIIKKTIAVEQYSEALRSLLEDLLVNNGVRLVERGRIDQLIAELGLTKNQYFVNKQTALEIGKTTGANRLIMGTIVGFQFKKERIRAYGISEDFDVSTCKIRIRVVDIESGNITLSRVVSGKFSMLTSGGSNGNELSDKTLSALEDAIDNLSEDTDFLEALSG